MARFEASCGRYTLKVKDVDHDPPHCHVRDGASDMEVGLRNLKVLNPPPKVLPVGARKCVMKHQEDMLRAWDDVDVRP